MKCAILLCLALMLSGCAAIVEHLTEVPADWGPAPVGPFEFYHGPDPQVFLGKPWTKEQ